MVIKYFFAICAILLTFLSVVKASEYTTLVERTSVTVNIPIYKSNLFFSKQSSHLLNKVILLTHPSNHNVLFENMTYFFQTAKRVYINLGIYLYSSIFSIFKW